MREQTERQCAECAEWFLASRPAWLCSPRCRQRARRRRVEAIVAEVLAREPDRVTK